MELTHADLETLALLTWNVRLATAPQLEVFQPGTTGRIEPLCEARLVKSAVMVVSIPAFDEPLCRWFPGDGLPNFGGLSHRMIQRRRRAARHRMKVYWALPRAVRMVGGAGGRLRQPHQAEHDLGVTEVYLVRRRLDSCSELRWLGEDSFKKLFRPRGKMPDAVLCDHDGNVHVAIEYGGLYPVKRLCRFHQHCARRSIPYEIW